MNKAEVRVDSGDGHRQLALQTALLIIDINAVKPGSAAAIITLHKMRNANTYCSPIPPISAGNADAAVTALQIMLKATYAFAGIDPSTL